MTKTKTSYRKSGLSTIETSISDQTHWQDTNPPRLRVEVVSGGGYLEWYGVDALKNFAKVFGLRENFTPWEDLYGKRVIAMYRQERLWAISPINETYEKDGVKAK